LLAVDIDRQAIERRDFPIGRRGYDPAAVDAHLRALAAEFEELQRASTGAGAEPSLAATAATQVQSILTAAETAAADIERQALANAKETRERADKDAERTREGALEQARAHVAAVAQATAVLLERVSTMDGEVDVLVESLRTGAGRLAGDLAAVQTNMGELYDAASGRAGSNAEGGAEPEPATPASATTAAAAPGASASAGDAPTPPPAVASSAFAPPEPAPASAELATAEPASAEPTPAAGNGDLDSARLVALNMALNGESRADADRYLSENFKLADRQKLIDEVYAAIEG
jgi:DivIVA domain-containing protein